MPKWISKTIRSIVLLQIRSRENYHADIQTCENKYQKFLRPKLTGKCENQLS